ncbi:MAG: hypothetical protein PF503_25675, partial [Desulfobacula sp.]|nr:hypothetical protein [Desulfobacula sp.]
FGSSTRRIKCLILYVSGLWCNAVDGAKDKQFRSSYKICGPKQFPKNCSCCGIHYNSLADYFRNTTHIGKPISYDATTSWFPIVGFQLSRWVRFQCPIVHHANHHYL